jgi:protocatechuate 3,4-dioxygenase beta subunit
VANEGKIVLGVTAAVVLLLLVARPAAAAPELATVTGTVTDPDTNPISGVQVTLADLQTTTDISGQYIFQEIIPGSYNMSFSKSGYETVNL